MISIAELENLNVDVEVAPPDQYIDSNLPMLLPEGTYDMFLVDVEPTRNRENDEPDGKGFVLAVEIATGEYGGRVVRNLRVWATKYQKNGVWLSGLGDLVRAIDQTAVWKTNADGARILAKAQDQKTVFRGKLVWEAFEIDYYRGKGGDGMVAKSKDQKDLGAESNPARDAVRRRLWRLLARGRQGRQPAGAGRPLRAAQVGERLRRRGFTGDQINLIQEIYRIIYLKGYNVTQAINIIEADVPATPERDEILSFIARSTRDHERVLGYVQ